VATGHPADGPGSKRSCINILRGHRLAGLAGMHESAP